MGKKKQKCCKKYKEGKRCKDYKHRDNGVSCGKHNKCYKNSK